MLFGETFSFCCSTRCCVTYHYYLVCMYVFLVEVPRVYIVVRVFLRIDRPLVEIQFASGFVINDYDTKIQLTTCCLCMV